MRPRSLRGRLLAIAAATTLAALVIAGFGMAHILERYITASIDERLGDRLAVFSAAVRKDGTIDPALADRLDTIAARDGDWRIDAPGGTAGSVVIDGIPGISFAGGQQIGPLADVIAPRRHGRGPRPPGSPPPGLPAGPDGTMAPPPPDADLSSRPFDARLVDGTAVHGRWQRLPTDAGPALVAVAMPRRMIEQPVREALMPLLAMLALLGALLAAATVVQLRLGLRPLDRLRTMLAEVRGGRRRHVDLDGATELQPVIGELNALIDANQAALERARGHVANLAHGLKTPLATLRLDLAGRDPDRLLGTQLDRIEGQVRHHLGRARAASLGELATPPLPLAPVLADLTNALARIHADRAVACTLDVAPILAVRCDRQDLEELLGNILDNGWRHARTALHVAGMPDGRMAVVTITDDGPGIPADRIAEALEPGRRLDERGEGHGFGIPIARELIELHGGTLAMAAGEAGGLTVTIRLPGGG